MYFGVLFLLLLLWGLGRATGLRPLKSSAVHTDTRRRRGVVPSSQLSTASFNDSVFLADRAENSVCLSLPFSLDGLVLWSCFCSRVCTELCLRAEEKEREGGRGGLLLLLQSLPGTGVRRRLFSREICWCVRVWSFRSLSIRFALFWLHVHASGLSFSLLSLRRVLGVLPHRGIEPRRHVERHSSLPSLCVECGVYFFVCQHEGQLPAEEEKKRRKGWRRKREGGVFWISFHFLCSSARQPSFRSRGFAGGLSLSVNLRVFRVHPRRHIGVLTRGIDAVLAKRGVRRFSEEKRKICDALRARLDRAASPRLEGFLLFLSQTCKASGAVCVSIRLSRSVELVASPTT